MMDDLFVLDGNLEIVGLIDAYKSLIWSNRYNKLGDCELYIGADTASLSLLQKGRYLMRPDDDMICQIRKIELDTDPENGNYLVITGFDAKIYLDQRVVWETLTLDGDVCEFIYSMVNDALGDATIDERALLKTNGTSLFTVGELPIYMAEIDTMQISYKNIGEQVRDFCERYGWGYRVVLDDGKLTFEIYMGTDRSDQVIFSEAFENLSTTKYVEDDTNIANVALIAGEGEGSARARELAGEGESIDRFEIYVDAKDISKTITWADLVGMFPSGTVVGSAGDYGYQLATYFVKLYDDNQLYELETNYPEGSVVTTLGVRYYKVPNARVADLPSDSPADADNVVLTDLVYDPYLITRGYEKLAEYGAVTSFEGTVEPNTTFVYKKDYFLGDIVTVQNEFGISVDARITEIIEVNDDTGYRVEPKFEYITEV